MYKDKMLDAQALECTDMRERKHAQPMLDLKNTTEPSLLTPQLLKRYSTNIIAPLSTRERSRGTQLTM